MRSNSRLLRLGCLLFLAGLLISGASWAASEHEEPEVRIDSQITLYSLLETTLARHPYAGVLHAGQGTVEAEITYGKHWFPEVMEVTGFHLSDRQLDDIGAYENEVALSLPLWLPGEKRAQTTLGEVASTAQVSREAEFRWRVSASLRQKLWQLMLARRQWELALEQEQRLQDVLEQVTIFTEAGDFSRADQLATMQELAIWKSETITLEAAYQDAVREYQLLTGLLDVPADISEVLSEEQEIREDHPALQMAMDQFAKAAASSEVTRQGNSASLSEMPTVRKASAANTGRVFSISGRRCARSLRFNVPVIAHNRPMPITIKVAPTVPMINGTPGCWTGLGHCQLGSKLTNSPCPDSDAANVNAKSGVDLAALLALASHDSLGTA